MKEQELSTKETDHEDTSVPQHPILSLLGTFYFTFPLSNPQIDFLNQLSEDLVRVASYIPKTDSVFLYQARNQFHLLFPELKTDQLDDLCHTISGILICMQHYKLSSLAALFQHLDQQKKKMTQVFCGAKLPDLSSVSL